MAEEFPSRNVPCAPPKCREGASNAREWAVQVSPDQRQSRRGSTLRQTVISVCHLGIPLLFVGFDKFSERCQGRKRFAGLFIVGLHLHAEFL